MQTYKLTQKELDSIPFPDKVRKKIKGRYVLEMDGEIYYGFHSKQDIQKALKPQPVDVVRKTINERDRQ